MTRRFGDASDDIRGTQQRERDLRGETRTHSTIPDGLGFVDRRRNTIDLDQRPLRGLRSSAHREFSTGKGSVDEVVMDGIGGAIQVRCRVQRVTRTFGGGSPDFVFCRSWHENGPARDLVGFEFLVDLGDIVKLEFLDLRLDATRFRKRNGLR